jgi:hypothetical protein
METVQSRLRFFTKGFAMSSGLAGRLKLIPTFEWRDEHVQVPLINSVKPGSDVEMEGIG